jgi:hypothetical protein
MTDKMLIPKFCWAKELKCVVEVISMGHFPTTVIVQLPDDSKIEIDIDKLETPKAGHKL